MGAAHVLVDWTPGVCHSVVSWAKGNAVSGAGLKTKGLGAGLTCAC